MLWHYRKETYKTPDAPDLREDSRRELGKTFLLLTKTQPQNIFNPRSSRAPKSLSSYGSYPRRTPPVTTRNPAANTLSINFSLFKFISISISILIVYYWISSRPPSHWQSVTSSCSLHTLLSFEFTVSHYNRSLGCTLNSLDNGSVK